MELTDAGRFYLEQCRILLEQYQKIPGHVIQKMESRAFEVAFAPSLGILMPSIAKNFEKWIPIDRKVVLRETAVSPRLDELIQGHPCFYLSYLSAPLKENEDGILQHALLKDTWAVTCSTALSEQISSDTCQSSLQLIHKLMELPVCQYTGEPELYEKSFCFLSKETSFSYEQIHTIFSFVSNMRLITVLPHLITRQEPGLCSLPLPSAPPIYLTVSYCNQGPDTHIVDNIIQTLQKHFCQMF